MFPRGVARLARLIGTGCALLLFGGCVAGVVLTPGPAPGAALQPTTTTVTIGGRPVLLHVPNSRRPETPAALVVVLHGYTGEAAGAVDFFGLLPLSDRLGFLVAAPQGTTDSEGHTFWNAANACCNFTGSQVDDSSHLSQVIATVVAGQRVDPGRVYVVGHSNGGFMASRLACEHADQVAAIASVAGAMDADGDCRPARPVSMLQVHGRADETIGYRGGEINGEPYTSAAGTVGRWRQANGCTGRRTSGAPFDADASSSGKDLTPTTWTGCRDDTEVTLWTIADAGHVPALTPAFTAELFDWLEAHRRRA